MTDIKNLDKLELGDLNYYLLENMKEMFEEESEIQDNILFIPEYSLSIRPKVEKSDTNMAVINYFLHSDKWDREIFECCAALGGDKKQALGMAEGSFIFGMMTGIRYMMKNDYFLQLNSEYNGSHKWKFYRSDIVGIGDIPETTNLNEIWDLIKDEIPKYLGNQKIVYIKVFASKNGNQITGECRVNDEAIDELGKLISNYAEKWNTENFGSKKEFFFAVQDDETYTPYPYNEEEIEKYIMEAANIFEKVETIQDYDNFAVTLGEKIGDYDLAEELSNFIPEICAERAFPNILYPEKIKIFIGENEEIEVNKTQIFSYYMIKNSLNHLIDHGHILKDLYLKFVAVSSIYSVICNAKEQGTDLTQIEGAKISITYGFSEEYKLR